MATRTLEIDLRQGTGASSEPMYGVVTVQRAKAKSAGGFEILPFETTLKLINGKATITEAETDGTGPFYDSVYLFRVQNGYCAPRWGFMAALPDGSTPITTGELPMVDPITGEGIYMDAQEWNDLYGTLPNRVSATETRLGVLDGLGQRGYTVDQAAGRTVKVWDYLNNREQLIYGDTGWRSLTVPAVAPLDGTGSILIRRVGSTVTLQFDSVGYTGAGTPEYMTEADFLPNGFRPSWFDNPHGLIANINTNRFFFVGVLQGSRLRFSHFLIEAPGSGTNALRGQISWTTTQTWPTSLPGVAV